MCCPTPVLNDFLGNGLAYIATLTGNLPGSGRPGSGTLGLPVRLRVVEDFEYRASVGDSGEWAVIEPWQPGDPEGLKTVIRRATPGAWRWLGYVARDADGHYVPDAPILEAEHFGPLPGADR